MKGSIIAVLNRLRDTPVMFRDGICEKSKTIFFKKPSDVFLVIADLNHIIQEEGYATIENWYDLLGIEYPCNDTYIGWDLDCLIEHGMTWLDFTFEYDEAEKYFWIFPKDLPCDAYPESKGVLYD